MAAQPYGGYDGTVAAPSDGSAGQRAQAGPKAAGPKVAGPSLCAAACAAGRL